MKRSTLQFISIGMIAIAITVFAVVFSSHPKTINASTAENVTGWALSDAPTSSDQIISPGNFYGGRGLGWISLNDTNQGSGGGTYGVNLGTDGKFIGKAWSEYGGWVDFNPSGPYPDNTDPHGASVTATCLSGNTECPVTGWIRFTAAPNDPQAGGWDGWVKMSGIVNSQRIGQETYSVMLSALDSNNVRTFSGYAWGDRVVGWVDFEWAKVTLPAAPKPIPGCMDSNASNYNKLATVSDGSCTYLCPDGTPKPTNGICPTISCVNADPNYFGMTGYLAECPCKPRSSHPEDCGSVPDICPTTTKFDGTVDQNTVDVQTTLPTGYSVKNNLCGIWGCTKNGDSGYNPAATIDDGTCKPCTPQSPDWNAATQGCVPPKGPKKPIFIET